MASKEIYGKKVTTEVVRQPRNNPEAVSKMVLTDAKAAFSDKPAIQQRRISVFKWMMDGCVLDGERFTETELATYLGTRRDTIANDVWHIKQKLGFMFKTDQRIRDEVSAVAGMLRQIHMEDRGRALAEYNRIQGDIASIRKKDLIPPPMLLQTAAQYLKIANECAKGLDKFLDVITKAANTVHVHGNAVIGGNQQNNNTQNTFHMDPNEAIKLLEEKGYKASVGTKKVESTTIDVDAEEE